jgi:hypothetical protein
MDFHPCLYMYTRLPFTTTKIVKETHRKRDSENGMKGTNSLTIFSRRECSCIEQLMQLFDSFFTKLLWCAPPTWTFELPKRHWWTRHQYHCHPKLWRSPQSLLINQRSKCNIQSVHYIGVLWAPHVDDATRYAHNSIRVKRNCGFLYCVWVCNVALSHSRPMLHFVFGFVPCLQFTCLNSAQLVLSLNP